MATNWTQDLPSHKDMENPVQLSDYGKKHCQESTDSDQFNYSQRAQWLRAGVLGADDGLVSIASLTMGFGAVKKDIKVLLVSFAGACSMAIGEFVSVYTQLDIEKKEMRNGDQNREDEREQEQLPYPWQWYRCSVLHL